MKAIFINGSPRKNKNTAQMLESAMKGAQDAGAEVEMIHLYSLNYKGCMGCYTRIHAAERAGILLGSAANHPRLCDGVPSGSADGGSAVHLRLLADF